MSLINEIHDFLLFYFFMIFYFNIVFEFLCHKRIIYGEMLHFCKIYDKRDTGYLVNRKTITKRFT